MAIHNCTPHRITIQLDDGRRIEFPPSGHIARLAMQDEPAGHVQVDGVQVPLIRRRFGAVTGLPPSLQPGDVVIVSLPVLQAFRGCQGITVVAPDTGPTAIRDKDGNIVAVRRFITM